MRKLLVGVSVLMTAWFGAAAIYYAIQQEIGSMIACGFVTGMLGVQAFALFQGLKGEEK